MRSTGRAARGALDLRPGAFTNGCKIGGDIAQLSRPPKARSARLVKTVWRQWLAFSFGEKG
jgi:hypothetical protein